jgi:hypothetical protein
VSVRRWGLALLVATVATMLSGCGITRVDAPLTLHSDRRLKMTAPKDNARVGLPVTVSWDVTDFPNIAGNHFGLYVDRAPLGAERDLRMRICGEQEKQPVQPGENRKVCKDDRKTVFQTAETSYTFTCFEPKYTAPKRTKHQHSVTVILLDANNRRVGEASTSVTFNVDAAAEKKCRGF